LDLNAVEVAFIVQEVMTDEIRQDLMSLEGDPDYPASHNLKEMSCP